MSITFYELCGIKPLLCYALSPVAVPTLHNNAHLHCMKVVSVPLWCLLGGKEAAEQVLYWFTLNVYLSDGSQCLFCAKTWTPPLSLL